MRPLKIKIVKHGVRYIDSNLRLDFHLLILFFSFLFAKNLHLSCICGMGLGG